MLYLSRDERSRIQFTDHSPILVRTFINLYNKDLRPKRPEIVITRRKAKVLHSANVHDYFKDLELQLGRAKLLHFALFLVQFDTQGGEDKDIKLISRIKKGFGDTEKKGRKIGKEQTNTIYEPRGIRKFFIDDSRSVNAAPPKGVARYLACSWRSANYAAAWAPAALARRVCCSYVAWAQGDFAEEFRRDGGDVGNCETCADGVGAAQSQGEDQAALQRSLCACHCPSGTERTGRYPRPQFGHADGTHG